MDEHCMGLTSPGALEVYKNPYLFNQGLLPPPDGAESEK